MNIKLEPVRTYLYGLLVPVIGVLVAYGVVSDESTALWIALGTALLGVPAVEVSRSKVSPVTDALGGVRTHGVQSGRPKPPPPPTVG